MSWRIAVRHRTGYQYGAPARASYNEVRMTPATTGGQHLLTSRLDIRPDARPLRYVDYWGTQVHAFDVHVPHDELVVTATSVVETAAPVAAPDRRLGHAGLARGPGPVRRAARPVPVRAGRGRGGRRRPVAAGGRDAGRDRPGRGALGQRDPRLRPRRDLGRHHLGRGPQPRPGRLPGLLAPGPGRAAVRRAARPVRLRLPPPAPGRARWTSASRPRATPGSSSGPATGCRWTRPTCPRWPSGTCWSPAAATTPTYGRWPASTPGRWPSPWA